LVKFKSIFHCAAAAQSDHRPAVQEFKRWISFQNLFFPPLPPPPISSDVFWVSFGAISIFSRRLSSARTDACRQSLSTTREILTPLLPPSPSISGLPPADQELSQFHLTAGHLSCLFSPLPPFLRLCRSSSVSLVRGSVNRTQPLGPQKQRSSDEED